MEYKKFKKGDVLKSNGDYFTIRGIKENVSRDEHGNRIDIYFLENPVLYKCICLIDTRGYCGYAAEMHYARKYATNLIAYFDEIEEAHYFTDKWVVYIPGDDLINHVMKCVSASPRGDGLYSYILKSEDYLTFSTDYKDPLYIKLADSEAIQLYHNLNSKREGLISYYKKYCKKLEAYDIKKYEPYKAYTDSSVAYCKNRDEEIIIGTENYTVAGWRSPNHIAIRNRYGRIVFYTPEQLFEKAKLLDGSLFGEIIKEE